MAVKGTMTRTQEELVLDDYFPEAQANGEDWVKPCIEDRNRASQPVNASVRAINSISKRFTVMPCQSFLVFLEIFRKPSATISTSRETMRL